MPDKDIIYEKAGNIQRCLNRIQETTNLKTESLDNIDIQDIFVLNLQRAIQSAIDLAAHLISSEGWGLPRTLRENFDILVQKKILPKELGENLKRMVGFRNIAIHDYSRIGVEILKNILDHRLKDLEEFYSIMIKEFGTTGT